MDNLTEHRQPQRIGDNTAEDSGAKAGIEGVAEDVKGKAKEAVG
jgi:hypothetical protein